MTATVDDLYRDKRGDTPTYRNPRMVRIREVLPYGVRAEVTKVADGSVPKSPMFTTFSFRTLGRGYVLCADALERMAGEKK